MTKKDFFRLLIKIFGLFIFIQMFLTIINTLSFAMTIDIITSIIILTSITGITIAFFVFLFHKTDIVLNFFKLDQGFDDDRIDFNNFNPENIIKVAIIIIGGLLIIENLPEFIRLAISAFKTALDYNHVPKAGDNSHYIWLVNAIKVTIGYLFLTNYSYVARYIKSKADKNEK